MELEKQTVMLVLATDTEHAQAVSFIEERSVAFQADWWVVIKATLQASTDARISDWRQRGLRGPM